MYGESDVEEFPLERLNPGDTLRIVTQHTNYVFTVVSAQEVQLNCSRADRPSGRVKICGCGFGFCHAFKPGHLFCVARMAFTFVRNHRPTRYRTTAIKTIEHRQRM